jgi:hypothetical protein
MCINCVKVYYAYHLPPTCFGHSCDSLQGGTLQRVGALRYYTWFKIHIKDSNMVKIILWLILMGNRLYVCSKSQSKQGCVDVTSTVDHSVFILLQRPLIEGGQKQILRRLFEPKAEEATLHWRKVNNEEHHFLNSLPNTIDSHAKESDMGQICSMHRGGENCI